MSEKVTDADMQRFHELMRHLADREKLAAVFSLQPEDVNPILAAHRIAAVERCVAMFKQLLVDAASGQEYEAAGCDVEGDDDSADTYRHAQGEIEQIIKRLDELAKDGE